MSIEIDARSGLTFVFMREAKLEKGAMQPATFTLKDSTAAEEARIVVIVRKQ